MADTREFETQQFMGIIQSARKHYIQLPYHNWEHVRSTNHEAIELLKVTRPDVRRRIDPRLLQAAAIWHDAGYHEDFRALGHRTHEHYASALAREAFLLSNLQAREQFAHKVREMIMATHEPHERSLISPGGIVLHIANLANMMQGEESFLRATRQVYDERNTLNHQAGAAPLSWEQHKARTTGYMEDIWPGLERELGWLAIPDADSRLEQFDKNMTALDRTRRPSRTDV